MTGKTDQEMAGLVERPMLMSVRAHGTPLIFFGFSLYFLASIILQKGYDLITEDQLFEYLTAVLYLFGALFCLMGFLTTNGRASFIAKYWLLGWAAFFLLVAVEEISWGQRIIGLETPGVFVSHNLQDETNLHNFSSDLFNRLFYTFVFVVGVVLPSLTMLSKTFDSFVTRWCIPLPQQDLIVPFALTFAFVAPRWIAAAPEMAVLLAVVFLWFSFILAAKLRRRQVRFTELNTLHLLVGLGGILLIQLVLAIFEENLWHENHLSEIKEFLFSACFLVFSYNLVLQRRVKPFGETALGV